MGEPPIPPVFCQPFSETSFQLFLGWGFLALLWLLKRDPSFQEPPRRILFLLLAAFISCGTDVPVF
jgi:hypothetical protein